MALFTASIKQNTETIRQYASVLFNVFYSRIKIIGFLISVFLVLTGGFIVKREGISLLLIFLGCILFTSLDAPARYMANRVIALFHGSFPLLVYSFYDDYFLLNDKETKISYDSLIKLIEDEKYYYLFQTKQYGIMVRKDSVSGDTAEEGFKEFIGEKAKLKWEKPPTIMSINLKTLIHSLKR